MATCKTCGKTIKWYHRDLVTGKCKDCTHWSNNWRYISGVWLILGVVSLLGWMGDTTKRIDRHYNRTTKSFEKLKEEQQYNLKRIGELDEQVQELRAKLKKSSP